MSIYCTASYFDSFASLPKSIQKKAKEFHTKIQDPNARASNGIHIEKIEQFADPSFRTGRVDNNYRTVLSVQGQDDFVLLYVGDHTAAYSWGMNRKFSWNEYIDAFQLINVEIVTQTIINQQSQEPNTKYFFDNIEDEKLLRLGVPKELLPIVRRIVDENDIYKIKLPDDVTWNLWNVMTGTDIDIVIAETEEGKAKEGEDKLQSANNKRCFIEVTDDEILQQIMEQGLEKWQIFLHPRQQMLVNAEYKGSMKVSGGAGTGKTVAAIHRLKYLCAKPNANVLFTAYTKTLCENLEEAIKRMGVPQNKFRLRNIDKVVMEMAKEYNVFNGNKIAVLDYMGEGGNSESLALWHEVIENEVTEFDEKFLYDEYVSVILYNQNKSANEYMRQARKGRTKKLSAKQKLEIWSLVEKYCAMKRERSVMDRLELYNAVTNYLNDNNIRPFTNVIADEFQDFSNPELRFLRALVAEGQNDLFITGDPFQSIYPGKKINFSEAKINIRGKHSQKLKINYRTTEPIKRTAVSVVKGMDYEDMDGGRENLNGYVSLITEGRKPIYKMAPDVNAEMQQVISWIDECKEQANIKKNEICIAAPTNKLMGEVRNFLHNEKIKYYQVRDGQRKGDTDGVGLCTYHSLKGLEFRAVILTGVNEQNLPSAVNESNSIFSNKDAVEQREVLSTKRSLLYVAITRARQLVYMVGVGQPTGLLQVTPDEME